jgi:regulator of protease activity HflC (stomatin/prohibitin superfamily)
MFDKLFSLLAEFWSTIWPFNVIQEYQNGVLLRLGKFKKVLTPGLHFVIPFIDEVMVHHVVVTTINLPSQSVTTKDNKQVVVKGVIKYRISDIKVFLLEVFDAIDAISDMSESIIKRTIMDNDWEQCMSNELDDYITKKARHEAKKWGIEILTLTLTDLGQIRSIKLFNDSTIS